MKFVPKINDYEWCLVVDFEATCDEPIQPEKPEIIQIGACLFNIKERKVHKELDVYIKPIYNPILTKFCKDLTGITQEQVDAASGFHSVYVDLKTMTHVDGTICWGSWGGYDYNELLRNTFYHNIPYKMPPHFNLKFLFSDAMKFKKQYGLRTALDKIGIPFEGKQHNALIDARNTIKLMPYILGDKSV